MSLDPTTIAMCELVAFAKNEQENALRKHFEAGNYATKVLERFKKLSPNAVLILGDKVPKNCWEYVQCRIDGVWVFAISKPEFMMVEVTTDGEISLDPGTAEIIFNYQND